MQSKFILVYVMFLSRENKKNIDSNYYEIFAFTFRGV